MPPRIKRNVSPGQLYNSELRDHQSGVFKSIAVIETYVQMVLAQPDLNLHALPNLPEHQKKARKHATKWHNDYRPNMAKTDSDIISYANEFETFFDDLVKYAKAIPTDPTAKDKLLTGLNILLRKVKENADNVTKVRTELDVFYASFQEDIENFQTDVDDAEVKIAGDSGEIKQLSMDIDAIHEIMKNDIKEMVGGVVGIFAGVGMVVFGTILEIPSGGLTTAIVGAGVIAFSTGAGIATVATADYSNQIKELKKKQEQLQDDKIELIGLKSTKKQIDGFVQALNDALIAVENLQKGWDTFYGKFSELISAVKDIDPQLQVDWLVDELKDAKDDWNDTLEVARKLQPVGDLPNQYYEDLEKLFDGLQPHEQA